MRGEHSACQLRVIRTIEASPIGLSVAKIPDRKETDKQTLNRGIAPLQAAGFPLLAGRDERANRWVFIGTSKFKTPPSFTFYSVIPQRAASSKPRTSAWATTT
jgi:predicted DNA-binding transcriptional regulator YafY